MLEFNLSVKIPAGTLPAPAIPTLFEERSQQLWGSTSGYGFLLPAVDDGFL